jgi:hypothetical protein
METPASRFYGTKRRFPCSSFLPVGALVQNSRRSFVVLSSLVGVLTLTSVLLRAMQGAPLTADAATGLMASDSRDALAVVFRTQTPAPPMRWTAIYIRHSKTSSGNALSVGPDARAAGDHFVIGNGDGAVDGEVQFTPRWNTQSAAQPAPGVSDIDPACISICLVGDFDKTAPTPTQLKRLEHLVQALQDRFRIPSRQVWLFDYPGTSAGVGKFFPASAFQSKLLR